MFHLYKIKCLTPLHVGSGESNYNIVDNEVERDLAGNPTIHSSGIKGALRKHFEKKLDPSEIAKIFGSVSTADEIGTGTYKFFDAKILSRPVRVSGALPSVPVTDINTLNEYVKRICDCGLSDSVLPFAEVSFDNCDYLIGASEQRIVNVDDCPTRKTLDSALVSRIQAILQTNDGAFALCKKISDVKLPVVAHNKLENGESKHLWYEEYVPEGSEFTFLLMTPDEHVALDLENELIQIGGNASIGYGIVKFTKLY